MGFDDVELITSPLENTVPVQRARNNTSSNSPCEDDMGDGSSEDNDPDPKAKTRPTLQLLPPSRSGRTRFQPAKATDNAMWVYIMEVYVFALITFSCQKPRSQRRSKKKSTDEAEYVLSNLSRIRTHITPVITCAASQAKILREYMGQSRSRRKKRRRRRQRERKVARARARVVQRFTRTWQGRWSVLVDLAIYSTWFPSRDTPIQGKKGGRKRPVEEDEEQWVPICTLIVSC